MQDAIDEILGCVDLLLLPSEHESFGLVALEALSSGVPVVATDRGGTTEVVEHGKTGFLHDPHDSAGMARDAVDLLRDAGRWKEFSDAARATALERFDEEKIVGRYLDYYDRVLSA